MGPHSHQQGGAGWHCEIVELKILRTARSMHSKLTALDFMRVDFGIFGSLIGKV